MESSGTFVIPPPPSDYPAIDPLEIIARYYSTDDEACSILVLHSTMVADYALQLLSRLPSSSSCTPRFIYEAAMLHDIGVFLTDAPDIGCFGSEPYLHHGYLGGRLLRGIGLDRHALVCERHTGSGLALNEIIAQNLQLPLDRTYMPITLEEKLICYADKFFSKSHPTERKSLDLVRRSMAHLGAASLARFEILHRLFSSDH